MCCTNSFDEFYLAYFKLILVRDRYNDLVCAMDIYGGNIYIAKMLYTYIISATLLYLNKLGGLMIFILDPLFQNKFITYEEYVALEKV